MTGTAQNIAIRGNKMGGRQNILDMPRCSVCRVAPHNLPNGGTFNTITFDTLDSQSEGMWSIANPTRVTCLTAGTYATLGTIIWPSDSTNFRQLALFKNGVIYIQIISAPGPVSAVGQQISAQIPLNAGDYVELRAAQNTATNPLVLPANAYSIRDISLQCCLVST